MAEIGLGSHAMELSKQLGGGVGMQETVGISVHLTIREHSFGCGYLSFSFLEEMEGMD